MNPIPLSFYPSPSLPVTHPVPHSVTHPVPHSVTHTVARDVRPHQYSSYVVTPQVLYNPDAFAREMELSSHNASQIRVPVRVPVARDITSLPRDITSLPRDIGLLPRDITPLSRDTLPLDIRHLPVPRVQHDISEISNTSYPGPTPGIPYFPTSLPFSQPEVRNSGFLVCCALILIFCRVRMEMFIELTLPPCEKDNLT